MERIMNTAATGDYLISQDDPRITIYKVRHLNYFIVDPLLLDKQNFIRLIYAASPPSEFQELLQRMIRQPLIECLADHQQYITELWKVSLSFDDLALD
jgi:hypothetical protein